MFVVIFTSLFLFRSFWLPSPYFMVALCFADQRTSESPPQSVTRNLCSEADPGRA